MSRESDLNIRFSVTEADIPLAEQLADLLKEQFSIDRISKSENGYSIEVWNSEHYYLSEVIPMIIRIVAAVFPDREIDAEGRGEYDVVDDIYEYEASYDPEDMLAFASRDHHCEGTDEEDETLYYVCRGGLTDEELKEMLPFSEKNGSSQLHDRLETMRSISESLANGTGWVDGFWKFKSMADDNGFVIVHGVLYDYIGTEEDLVIPEGVKVIGDPNAEEWAEWVAFETYCYDMKSVTIPSSVTKIYPRAFDECSELTSITVDESNNTYCSDGRMIYTKDRKCIVKALSNLSGELDIPQGIVSIGDNAFSTCMNLTDVTIPEGVTSIGKEAFALCFNLTNIKIPDTVTAIAAKAFESTNLKSVTVPACAVIDPTAFDEGVTVIIAERSISCR